MVQENFIPLNDLTRNNSHLFTLLKQEFNNFLKSGNYILGEKVTLFETTLGGYLNHSNVVGVASGSDALEISLRSLGVSRGDLVATVANAGGYATGAVLRLGASPVFVDVEVDTLLMSPDSLRENLEQLNKNNFRCKAVVVTHLYGNVAKITEIKKICEEFGIFLVEDCAQSLGSKVDGKPTGTFGNISCHSFFPTKNLGAFGDGGAIATSDHNLAKVIRSFAQYGWEEKYHVKFEGGMNSRLDEIQAAILLKKFSNFEDEIYKRTLILDQYKVALSTRNILATWDLSANTSAHLAVVKVRRRKEFINYLNNLAISSSIHYPVLDYFQTGWALEKPKVPTPVCEKTNNEIVTIPLFSAMTPVEIERVCNALNGWDY